VILGGKRLPTRITMPGGQSSLSSNDRSSFSVLVADDHPITRDGVQYVLERQLDFHVIAAVGDANAALSEALRLKPHIVVMDISMPGMNGLDATRILAGKLPGTAVIILSSHSSPIIVRRAIEAGACGYVSKDLPSEELVRAVRSGVTGKRYIGQGLVQGLLDVKKSSRLREYSVELLTATETDILKLVAEGKSNAQVASVIGLTARTVETYRLRLMRKLELDSLPSLVKYAIRHGLTGLD
jgi:DNA-binding NarL/FixJ family response regulator